jgi:hypothetical protein
MNDAINSLCVAGRFDDVRGRESKIAKSLYDSIGINATLHNGGSFSQLESIVNELHQYNLIFWLADVPNDKEKLVKEIKQKNNACILVTSKRNMNNKYSFPEIIAHALNIKSNLFIEFSSENERYKGRVIDPLGNVFLDYEEDMGIAGKVIGKRVQELFGFSRISSKSIEGKCEVPDEKDFFALVRTYADVFHNLIHPVSSERFLGNLSFRCERGFPSYREGNMVYVSQRNVDKRFISRDSCVPVMLDSEEKVKYISEHKPSVDTPIQIRLYNYYPQVRYMLHSHTYIAHAPFTENIVPCGAVEEAEEVKKIQPNHDATNFFVNLLGHGSLALASDVQKLREIPYIPRPMPEIHKNYAIEFR